MCVGVHICADSKAKSMKTLARLSGRTLSNLLNAALFFFFYLKIVFTLGVPVRAVNHGFTSVFVALRPRHWARRHAQRHAAAKGYGYAERHETL